MKIELPPVRVPLDYEVIVEKEIMRALKDVIFQPLMDALPPRRNKKLLSNSMDILISALLSGRIYFYRGKFQGDFSAEISKELKRIGATWDGRNRMFTIPSSELPAPIRTAIVNSQTTFERAMERVTQRLASINGDKVISAINLEKILDKILYSVDAKLQESFMSITPPQKLPAKSAGSKNYDESVDAPQNKTNQALKQVQENITISPKMSEQEVAEMRNISINQVKVSIKGWTDEKVEELRVKISERVLAGERYEGVIKEIQQQYQVGENKAKFLARQETNIMTSKLKEKRYVDAGVTQYRWVCVKGSPKHPVRDLHKKLDGTTQSWNNPPIVNEKGERKNPGEDYNCRCVARPIVTF